MKIEVLSTHETREKTQKKYNFESVNKELSWSFVYFVGFDKVRKTLGFVPQPNLRYSERF